MHKNWSKNFSALPIEFKRKNSVSPTNFILNYLSLGTVDDFFDFLFVVELSESNLKPTGKKGDTWNRRL